MDSGNNELKKPPILKRMRYSLKRSFSSRKLLNYEMEAKCKYSPDTITIRFFAARKPIFIDISIPANISVRVTRVQFLFKDGVESESKEGEYLETDQKTQIRIYSPAIVNTRQIEVLFNNLPDRFNYEVRVFVARENSNDLILINEAVQFFQTGRYDGALEQSLEYDNTYGKNPYVQLLIAQIYDKQKRPEPGQEYALKAIVNGLETGGLNIYRELATVNSLIDRENITSIKSRCAEWEIPSHYGAIVLLKDQQYILGLDGWFLKKHREILQIKRPVAARMLTSLVFNFSNRERLLYTDCRIITQGGQIKKLESERFVVGDSKERNIYITTEEEKSGTWILPDLSVGDIIEYNYHLLCQDGNTIEEGKPHVFIITPLAHEFHPTYQCSASIQYPSNYAMKYDIFNGQDNIEYSDDSENDKRVMKFDLSKYIPERNTDFYRENYFRNPILACATSGYTWSEIAKFVLNYNLGDPTLDDDLPEALEQMLEGNHEPIKKLRHAFYWTRDKLKYAAIGSAIQHIGKIGRAQAIVDSGVADCKDKAYLLNQVCNRLGLTAEFIAMSSKYGIIFENLPSDQFDHVFVRVKLNNDWLYLDASSRFAVFGSRPANFQSMKMLVLNSDEPVETMAAELPERNRLIITETLDEIDSEWLSGTFHIHADGNIARLIDENWKWYSINTIDQLRSAQTILKGFMPGMLLVSCDRICNTSTTDIFEAVGTHRRCQLGVFEKRRVGVFDWRVPTLPIDYWRNLSLDKFFVFYQPSQIEINLIFMGNLADRIEEFSRAENFENEICKISDDIVREKGRLLISRRLTIKKKFVERADIHLLPDALEHLEKTLQFAITFRVP